MPKVNLAWRERPSDSPLIDSVWMSSTPVATSRTVIADPCTSIALVRDSNGTRVAWMGPKTKPYYTTLPAGYSCITIRLKPGVSLKDLPTQNLTNSSCTFPADADGRFWFAGSRLQFPDFDHAELFVDQLHSLGHLRYEMPLSGHAQVASDLSSRTHARKIRRATGLTPYQLHQLQRMHQVLRLLKQGIPAAEVAMQLAFVDQPHLTHASRQFFGHTPAQLFQLPQTP